MIGEYLIDAGLYVPASQNSLQLKFGLVLLAPFRFPLLFVGWDDFQLLPCPFGSSGRNRGQDSFIHEEDYTSFIQGKTSLEPPFSCAQVGDCRASAYPGRFQT